MQCKQIHKHLITKKIKIRNVVPYVILFSEIGLASIKAIAMVQVIRYLKKN